tara:strand:- start:83 stop:454 length:372 start_codon:yes stop_codon:yes gene_type:complete
MIKYMYFRKEATIGDDNASGDSACYNAANLVGMQPLTNSILALYFTQLNNMFPDDPDSGEGRNDRIKLTIGANTHKTVMKNIVDWIAHGSECFMVIGDNLSTDTEYIEGVTAVNDITVKAVNT